MLSLLRSKRKPILGMLFTALGTMWLSFAIAPCVLAATLVDRPHHCCPHFDGKAEPNKHMHDGGNCVSCEVVGSALQSANDTIQSSKSSSFDYEPIIIEWNAHQITKAIVVAIKPHTPVYLPIPPPLRYRVLLI